MPRLRDIDLDAKDVKERKQLCSPNCTMCFKDTDSNNRCPNASCPDLQGLCKAYRVDNCGCCLVCAKLEGESCGGFYGAAGFCAKYLRCTVSEKRVMMGKISDVGVCKGKL